MRAIQQWIRDVIRRGHRIVLTTRPSQALKEFLQAFDQRVLQPLTSDQQLELARKWLGTERQGLDDEFEERTDADPLWKTPLLVTIAAIVFERMSALPRRRAELYRLFLDAWWLEGLERGLRDEIGLDLRDVALKACDVCLIDDASTGGGDNRSRRRRTAAVHRGERAPTLVPQ